MEWYFYILIILGVLTLFQFVIALVLTLVVLRPRKHSDQFIINRQLDRENVDYLFFDNLHKEDFSLQLGRTTIVGKYIVNAESTNKWVIISHGHDASHLESVKYLNMYYKLGFNCLVFDQRYFGRSVSSNCSLGYYERKDLVAVIDMLCDKYGEIFLVLHGESMGASSSICALEFTNKPACVVADCAYASADKFVYAVIKKVVKLFAPLVFVFAKLIAFLSCGCRLNKVSPIKVIKHNNTPILFIHGTNDQLVSVNNSIDMFNASTSKLTRLELFDKAKHVESHQLDSARYALAVQDFTNKVYLNYQHITDENL
ncbi:MAG: hypothetical protein RR248_05445 [Clostridia bacterium]